MAREKKAKEIICPQKMGSFLFTRVIFSFVTLLGYHMVFGTLFELPSLRVFYCFGRTVKTKVRGKKKRHKELYEQINKNYQRLFDGSNMVLKLGEGCNLVLFSVDIYNMV